MIRTLFPLGAAMLALMLTAGIAHGQVERTAEVVAAGGGTASNGSLTLRGTIGQAGAMPAGDSSTELDAGFWPSVYLSDQTATAAPEEESERASGAEEEMPSEFELEPAYPNPFNPTTRIVYALPEPADVRMTVYNSLGQEVTTLVDRPQAAGRHETVFRAGALPSGIYYYRLRAGSFVRVRSVTLLK